MKISAKIWLLTELVLAAILLLINNSLISVIIAAAIVADAILQISYSFFKQSVDKAETAKALQEEQERQAKALQEEQERQAKALQEKGYQYLFNPENLNYVRQQLLTIINADDQTDMHKLFNRLPGKMKLYNDVKSFACGEKMIDSALIIQICELLNLYLPSRGTRFFSDYDDTTIQGDEYVQFEWGDDDWGNI